MTIGPLAPSGIWKVPGRHHMELLRNPWYAELARLQHTIAELTMRFWVAHGGQTIFLPITTGSVSSPMGSGSDSSPVAVDLDGATTYLADSMQFMLEVGVRLTGRACYYLMPSFRGETTDERHLSQFFHSEAEIEGGLEEVIRRVEDYLSHLAAGLLDEHEQFIGSQRGSLEPVARLAEGGPFRQITFEEAARLLPEGGLEGAEGARDLTPRGEVELMRALGEFVWVTHWDHGSVPFYQAFDDEARETARNADLLLGLGETVGAGERHVSSEDVAAALDLHEVAPAPYHWYCEIRDAAPLRTAGFGLGVERFLAWLLDHHEIRDCQLLPREHGKSIVP